MLSNSGLGGNAANGSLKSPGRLIMPAPAVLLGILLLLSSLCSSDHALGAEVDPLEPYTQALADFREQVWAHGFQGPTPYAPLQPVEAGLQAIADRSNGPLRAKALLELGRVQRTGIKFAEAVTTLTEAARLANETALPQTAFDAWMNLARAYVIGLRNYGAASDAVSRAETVAGAQHSRQQLYDLAEMRSVLLESRGEAEPALIEALTATRLAQNMRDKYSADLDLAISLGKIFHRCQWQPIWDTQTAYDQDVRWGACERAMRATQAFYSQAARDAEQRGWFSQMDFAEEQARGVEAMFVFWKRYHEQQDAMQQTLGVFHPKDAKSVLSTDFWWGSTTATADGPGAKRLGEIIDHLMVDNQRALGTQSNALDLTLQAGRPGTSPEETARLLAQAVEQQQIERQSFFDARRRGTTIEGNPEITGNLAGQLLSLHREAEAFDAFETGRARGLGELNQVLDRPETTDSTRQWLAAMLLLDARTSETETKLIAKVIATGKADVVYDQLDELQKIRTERGILAAQGKNEIARLQAVKYQPAGLADLQAASRQAGVPILLYEVNGAILVGWYVGPDKQMVRNIFAPEQVLRDRVERLRRSASESTERFDAEAARELFLFLISPFQDLLTTSQIMIVPAGPLVSLPFETLLMPQSDQPLIERWSVSYAPSATLAARALRRPVRPVGATVAVFDPDIDHRTQESAGLKKALGQMMNTASPASISVDARSGIRTDLIDGGGMHLLMHGRFNQYEPLMSEMYTESRSQSIRAAEMIGLKLRGLRLAVLSGCETGQVGVRLSNEIFGFPWALLAGGVDAAVVSRWLVDGTSNRAWMQTFYSAAKSGLSPPEAAAKAMRQMRADGLTHPYFWAAMQVSGR